jgi:hypothetical protein
VGAKAISPNAAKPKRKYLFISGFPELDGLETYFIAPLRFGSGSYLTISEHAGFHRIATNGRRWQRIICTTGEWNFGKKRNAEKHGTIAASNM